MATAQTRTEISQLYVALFGRAPDTEGLAYWAAQRDAGTSLMAVADRMYATTPARQDYASGMASADVIQAF